MTTNLEDPQTIRNPQLRQRAVEMTAPAYEHCRVALRQNGVNFTISGWRMYSGATARSAVAAVLGDHEQARELDQLLRNFPVYETARTREFEESWQRYSVHFPAEIEELPGELLYDEELITLAGVQTVALPNNDPVNVKKVDDRVQAIRTPLDEKLYQITTEPRTAFLASVEPELGLPRKAPYYWGEYVDAIVDGKKELEEFKTRHSNFKFDSKFETELNRFAHRFYFELGPLDATIVLREDSISQQGKSLRNYLFHRIERDLIERG